MTAIALNPKRLDVAALEQKVKAMYRDVAVDPHGEFHFEMGRALAERLGYARRRSRRDPARGHRLVRGRGLLLRPRRRSSRARPSSISAAARGWTAFVAALKVGRTGRVIGDRHDRRAARQGRAPARRGRLRQRHVPQGLHRGDRARRCELRRRHQQRRRSTSRPDKTSVFREAARLLQAGGRLALADIVTDVQLARGHHLQRDAVGRLHRRCDAGRRLRRGDRGRRAAGDAA